MEGSIRTIFMAEAFSRLEYPTSWRYISDAIVLNLPPMMTGVPKSARERTKERSRATQIPSRIRGSTMSPKMALGLAPRSLAARMLSPSSLVRIPPRNKAFKGTKERLCIRITPQQL